MTGPPVNVEQRQRPVVLILVMVKIVPRLVYLTDMSNGPQTLPPPAGWEASLARSKVQLEAGERVALMPILDRLRAAAARLQREQGVTADGAESTSGR